jgi:hypothetical protein
MIWATLALGLLGLNIVPTKIILHSVEYEVQRTKGCVISQELLAAPSTPNDIVPTVEIDKGRPNHLVADKDIPAGFYSLVLQEVQLRRLRDNRVFQIPEILIWQTRYNGGSWNLDLPPNPIARIEVLDEENTPLPSVDLTIQIKGPVRRSITAKTDSNGAVFVFSAKENLAVELMQRDLTFSRIVVSSE